MNPRLVLLTCLLTFTCLFTLTACDDEEPPPPTCAQDCAATNQVCDTQTLSCVACLFSSDCANGQSCIAKACVDAPPTCTRDEQCASSAPQRFCSSSGRCEWSCLDNTHCTTPPNTRCDPEAHACIPSSTSSGADASDADASDTSSSEDSNPSPEDSSSSEDSNPSPEDSSSSEDSDASSSD